MQKGMVRGSSGQGSGPTDDLQQQLSAPVSRHCLSRSLTQTVFCMGSVCSCDGGATPINRALADGAVSVCHICAKRGV